MPVKYGGRLGAILEKYPKTTCPKCHSPQVQIVNHLVGDSGWRCRKCRHEFELEFNDHKEFVKNSIGNQLL